MNLIIFQPVLRAITASASKGACTSRQAAQPGARAREAGIAAMDFVQTQKQPRVARLIAAAVLWEMRIRVQALHTQSGTRTARATASSMMPARAAEIILITLTAQRTSRNGAHPRARAHVPRLLTEIARADASQGRTMTAASI